jgi:glycosyltransferase involved in cell wall biosynthesis
MILTIAITTYNRPIPLKATVESLIPQLNENVQVTIFDNCSDVVVKDYLEQSIPHFTCYPIKVIRHKVNIGPDANFARTFELCETPYIWTLADDDLVRSNAIETIFNEIEHYKHLDLIGFNFNSNCNIVVRDKPIIINNTKAMSNNLDFFGNWLFMSCSVYKAQEYLKYIRFASWGAYSMASQIVPAMMAISKHKTLVLSEKTIVDNVPIQDIDQKWSDVKLSLVITSLLEAPVNFSDDYLVFGRKLAVQQIESVTSPIYVIIKSLDGNLELIDNYHIYLYKQHFYRTIEFRSNKTKAYLTFWVWCFLLRNPSLLGLVRRIFKQKFIDRTKMLGKFDLFQRSAQTT